MKIAWVGLALLAACKVVEQDPMAAEDEPPPILTVVLDSPAAGQLVGGQLTVTGTATAPAGDKIATVTVQLGDKTLASQDHGGAFAWVVTLPPGCNVHPTLQVVARNAAGDEARADAIVEVDTCAPKLTLASPLAGATVVGQVRVQGSVLDKRFESVTFTVDDAKPRTVHAVGPFDVVLDRGTAPTADVTLVVHAVDLAGNASELTVQVHAVRGMQVAGGSMTGPASWLKDVKTVQIGDITGDGVVDAVTGGSDGVVVRPGQTGGGTVQFFDPQQQDATLHIAGLDVVALRVRDLDGDGDLDVLAAGTHKDGTGGLWGLLNIGSGLRLVADLTVPGIPTCMELADLDLDGQPDVLLGTATAAVGLVVVRVPKNPQCKVKNEHVSCAGANDGLKSAELFLPSDVSENKGVQGIASLAVGDFFSDPVHAPDVCVGESGRPLVSCYRNRTHDGHLDHAEDGWQAYDCQDVAQIVGFDWSGDGVLDLFAASGCGKVRWLKGKGDGTFEFAPGPAAQMTAQGVTQLLIAPVGPGGLPCLVILSGGASAQIVPLGFSASYTPNLPWLPASCMPGVVLGGQVASVTAADVDGDGVADLVAADGQPPGTPVAKGKATGEFDAPLVLLVCALPTEFGEDLQAHDPAQMAVADFTGDGKPDVLAVGSPGRSLQAGIAGACPVQGKTLAVRKPAWPVQLWVNQGTGSFGVQRATEMAPYAQPKLSGAAADCPTIPPSFGAATGLAMGDVDGDKLPDLAVIRGNSSYPLGYADSTGSTAVCLACGWDEVREVDNAWGVQSADDGDATGRCCRTFADDDYAKKKPLVGYGGGAPMARASLWLWLAKNTTAPFGMSNGTWPSQPGILTPAFAQAAGRNPRAVALLDLDGDGKDDVVTATEAEIDQTRWLEARLRVFRSIGPGQLAPVPQTGDQAAVLDPELGWTQSLPVSYRVMGRGPTGLRTARLGTKQIPSILASANKYDQVAVLQAAAQGQLQRVGELPAGSQLATVAAQDVDGDGRSDLLVAVKAGVGVLHALDGWFDAVKMVWPAEQDVVDAALADVNADGYADVVLVDRKAAQLLVLLGDGQGGFMPWGGRVALPQQPQQVVLADLDGDGCVDFVVRGLHALAVVRNHCKG